MGKSVYSLVLLDEVVAAIDRLAYQKGTNRSQLINDLLAETVGFLTPKQKVQRIIQHISETMLMGENIRIQAKSDYGSIQFSTYLQYKYNPSIRYSFEFYTNDQRKMAVLKVTSRTKSEELNTHLENFFRFLTYIDKHRFHEIHAREVLSSTSSDSNNKYYREFLSGLSLDDIKEERVAEYLGNYLLMLDKALKYYFSHLDQIEDIPNEMDKIYCNYMKNLPLFKQRHRGERS